MSGGNNICYLSYPPTVGRYRLYRRWGGYDKLLQLQSVFLKLKYTVPHILKLKVIVTLNKSDVGTKSSAMNIPPILYKIFIMTFFTKSIFKCFGMPCRTSILELHTGISFLGSSSSRTSLGIGTPSMQVAKASRSAIGLVMAGSCNISGQSVAALGLI